MQGMVNDGQVEESSRIAAPVGHAGRGEIEARWNLPPEGIPGREDIGGPEDGPIALRTEIGGARQNHGAAIEIATEPVVNRGGMKERVDIEVTSARTDFKVAAVGRQVGLCFVEPDRIEALLHRSEEHTSELQSLRHLV